MGQYRACGLKYGKRGAPGRVLARGTPPVLPITSLLNRPHLAKPIGSPLTSPLFIANLTAVRMGSEIGADDVLLWGFRIIEIMNPTHRRA